MQYSSLFLTYFILSSFTSALRLVSSPIAVLLAESLDSDS